MKEETKFSLKTHWISRLGETTSKTYYYFNLAIILYTIFNIYFIKSIQILFATNLQSVFSYIFFITYSLSLILILFFPQNINFSAHRRVSNFLFVSILSGLILIFLATKSVFLAITIIVGVGFSYSFILLYRKYHKIPIRLSNSARKDRSFLIRNSCLLEWVFFALVLASQILLVA